MRKTRSSRTTLPLAVQLLAPPSVHTRSPSVISLSPLPPASPSLISPTSQLLPNAKSPASATSCLPPLFDTPTPELVQLHDKLYHFIALLLRAYVLQWYQRISPRDTTTLPEINAALVPILRPLLDIHREELVDLLLLHAPALLLLHLRTLREARQAVAVRGGELGDAYHARLPLRSVTKEDGDWVVNSEYYVAVGIELQPTGGDVQKTLVAELLAGVVLGNISKRITMPWFWAQIGHRLLSPSTPYTNNDLEKKRKTGLVQRTRAVRRRISSLYSLWAAAPPPERKYARLSVLWLAVLRELFAVSEQGLLVRMLFGFLGIVVLLLSPIVDRLAPVLITRALTPQLGMNVLTMLEKIIFPCDGWPSPDEFCEPSPEEQALLWSQLRGDVRQRAPGLNILGVGWEDRTLDLIAHKGPNAHLAAMLYDAVVGTLAPDLLVQ